MVNTSHQATASDNSLDGKTTNSCSLVMRADYCTALH